MSNADHARDFYILGLKNAHAMEKQALSIMKPQIERLSHYPDVLARLKEHQVETENQIDRLDRVLESLGEGSSTFKDAALSALGSLASLGHASAGDEILKNSFANLAFENYEIGAYTSLITLAEMAGDTASVSILQESLDEEKRMASWVAEHVPQTTRQFISLKNSSETAKA